MGKWNHSSNFVTNLSIKWKFSLVVVPLLLLMGLASTVAIERHLADAFYQELLEDAQSIGNSVSSAVAAHVQGGDLAAVRDLFVNTTRLEKELVYVYVTGPDGKLLAHSFAQAFPAELQDRVNFRETGDPGHTIVKLPGGEIHDVSLALGNGGLGTLHVGMSAAALHEHQVRVRNNLLAITLFITGFGLLVLLYMIGLITKPLADLAGAVEDVGKNRLNVKMTTSDDEIGQLARAFNRMSAELDSSQARREASERAKGESDALYRSLLDNINLGISLINKDFEVVFANAAQGRLLKRAPEKIFGHKCYREFERRESVCPHCPGHRAMQSGRSEEAEASGRNDAGEEMHVKINAFPVRNEQQEITGFIEIVTDISGQKGMDEALQRIKNIETIGQLAGGLAHDFNNLLTAIIGNIELARLGSDPAQDTVVRLDAAGRACEQARRLTNQLLTFAKGGVPVKKLAYLPTILNEACHFALSGSSIHYILDAPENLRPVEIDSSQMSQVIHNLLNNAREAMATNPTGKIFVVAENVDLEPDSKLPLPPGPYVKLAIVDEGQGIRPEILGQVFNPYFTTKEMGVKKGTGLGLAICHSIIHRHGGLVTVDSKESRGTTFTIYLPAADRDLARQTRVAGAAGEAGQEARPVSLRVLILEDEEEVAHIATSFLATLHHRGEVASTGNQAIKLFQEAQASDHPFDLLILDLTIRGGMGGEEVLGKLREIAPGIPAIVSSGYTEDPIMTDCRGHGFQAALPKPFNQATFRDAVAKATQASGAAEGHG
jgi:PAS domain S-box-containing protein